MKKALFISIISVLVNSTALQAQYGYQYNLIVDGIDTEADVKKVSFIVSGLQDGTVISWRDDRSFAKVKSTEALSEALIEDALNNEGYHLLDLENLTSVGISSRSLSNFPQPINTGNPVLDAQNYAVVKAQWIQDHPALYENLTRPSSSTIFEEHSK